jgi:hypothetical protein
MAAKLFVHLRRQWIGVIALFVALGGTAVANHEQIFSSDIVNGEVKEADVGNAAVASAEVKNESLVADDLARESLGSGRIIDGSLTSADVKNDTLTFVDLAPNSIGTGRIIDGSLTGVDVANNSLKGADIDEATLDIGDAARAYARVDAFNCTGTPGTCTPEQSKRISSVTRTSTGSYCVTAPGIDSNVTPAAVTVDSLAVNEFNPAGNASAMSGESFGCGASGQGFVVDTERQFLVVVDAGGGTNNASVSGLAKPADNVAFTIVIP